MHAFFPCILVITMIACFLLSFCFSANAQEIDVYLSIKNKFDSSGYPVQPRSKLWRWIVYHIENIQVQAQDVQFGAPILNFVPPVASKDNDDIRNCTSLTRTGKVNLNIANVVGHEVVLDKSFKINQDVKVSLKIDKAGIDIGNTLDVNLTTREKQSFTHTENYTRSFDQDVPAFTRLYYNAERKNWIDRIPFTASVVVDAMLYVRTDGAPPLEAQYDKLLLSGAFPETNERTFSVTGVVDAAKVSKAQVYYHETKLDPNDPNDCPSPPH